MAGGTSHTPGGASAGRPPAAHRRLSVTPARLWRCPLPRRPGASGPGRGPRATGPLRVLSPPPVARTSRARRRPL